MFGLVQNIWTLHILDTSRNTTLLGSKVRNKKLLTIWKALWGCSMHLPIQLKSWLMTQFMSQQIPSIKLRLPTKQSYLIIYYIFYLIKISIFLFSFFLFLFSHLTIIHFFCPQEMERNNKKLSCTSYWLVYLHKHYSKTLFCIIGSWYDIGIFWIL